VKPGIDLESGADAFSCPAAGRDFPRIRMRKRRTTTQIEEKRE
jgi:hypothetical protein